ncbi:MAG: helix-turn-helix domain-containing protein [Micrococcales bacterium]|nr:helix-turn-helix domain-containing protein [Micrococcales bacterium]MCL2669014.1 helix-turn-helix domain-containing protein [Micrococcales bacterium]
MTTPRVTSTASLGAAVRQARRDQGLSQAELARDAQVGRQWLVGLESGDKVSAPLDMVLRVLRELGLAVTLDPVAREPSDDRPIITATQILQRFGG